MHYFKLLVRWRLQETPEVALTPIYIIIYPRKPRQLDTQKSWLSARSTWILDMENLGQQRTSSGTSLHEVSEMDAYLTGSDVKTWNLPDDVITGPRWRHYESHVTSLMSMPGRFRAVKSFTGETPGYPGWDVLTDGCRHNCGGYTSGLSNPSRLFLTSNIYRKT